MKDLAAHLFNNLMEIKVFWEFLPPLLQQLQQPQLLPQLQQPQHLLLEEQLNLQGHKHQTQMFKYMEMGLS